MSNEKPKMEKMIIGFSKAKSPFAFLSYLIRWFDDNAPFSHAYIKMHTVKYDATFIYQADFSGCHFYSEKIFLKSHTVVDEIELEITKDERDIIVGWCLKNSGANYGFINLVFLALKVVFNMKAKFGDGNKSFICSELVTEVLKIINLMNKDVCSDMVTPHELYKFLKKEDKNV